MKAKLIVVAGTITATLLAMAPAAWAGPDKSAGHAPTTAPAASITWGTCASASLKAAGAQCGYLAVPLDYRHPNGTKIQLAVSRIPHKTPDSKYQGVMLVNPGGPGGSGLGLSRLGQSVPNHAGDAYDWIGFDPRGVGSSVPAVSCDPDYFGPTRPEYIPTTNSLEKTWLASSKAYATACGKNAGALLQHMTTVDSAKDMDSIRAALGQRQINYYGFSYGTYLGQVYSTLFPQRVRRMVLDSNVDPRDVWYEANLNQDVAFQKTVEIWFGWLAKYDSVYHLGKTESAVEKLWYKEKDQLRTHPAGGVVGPDEWTDIFLLAGYYQSTWLDLADAFAGWVHDGDAATVVSWYEDADGPGDDNSYAVYNAVQCTDVQWPRSWNQWRRDNWATYQKAPFETWGNAWFNAPCLYWPAKASTPVKVDGRKVASALLIDETLDAATPYEGSLEVRRLFPNSSLIAEPGGTSHANTLDGDACVDNQIAAYLANGTRPARRHGDGADTLCAPLPQPVPTGAAASSAARAAAPAAARAESGASLMHQAIPAPLR
ncbi:alpha/beta hydrolase [Rugosimonospora acidiphila]|uniref:Alpha/beta hydrolase n=1 Tax=Rugosimonospora acidiphila TaxID=556531 RepID=A0ABP9SIC7_9ACTN